MKPSPAEIALFLFELIVNSYKPEYLAVFLGFLPLSERELSEEDRARVQRELMHLQAFINDYSVWNIYGGGAEGANIMFAFVEHLRAYEKENPQAAIVHEIMGRRVELYASIFEDEVSQQESIRPGMGIPYTKTERELIRVGKEFADLCGRPEDVFLSTAASMYFGATFVATLKAIKIFVNE